jgi:hypothetical protein
MGNHSETLPPILPLKYFGQEKSNENATNAVFESTPPRDSNAASASAGAGTQNVDRDHPRK